MGVFVALLLLAATVSSVRANETTVSSSSMTSSSSPETAPNGTSPGPSETTESSGSTASENIPTGTSDSTISGAASVSGSIATTAVPITAGPPTTATLPPVNVSYVQFVQAPCSNGFCSYSYVAPYNNPVFLNNESSIIATDQTYYNSASDQVSAFNKDVSKTINDAQQKVDDLRDQLNNAQSNLIQMQAELNATISNTTAAVVNLNYASYYIRNNIDSTSPVFYCTLPPTPAPTTTTPTTPPTTTPGECEVRGEICSSEYNGTCMYESGKPFCTECPGNMDGFQLCEASTCGVNLNATYGPFWSPGYNQTNVTMEDFAGKICTWNYPTAYLFNTNETSYDLSGLGQATNQLRMTLNPIPDNDIGAYPISSDTNLKKVNGFLKTNSIQSFQIQLIVPDGFSNKDSIFYWDFLSTPPSSSQ